MREKAREMALQDNIDLGETTGISEVDGAVCVLWLSILALYRHIAEIEAALRERGWMT